jgi:hypothetical protein
MPAETIMPTDTQPAGHGGTPELPQPKTPLQWAELRGERTDALSEYQAQARQAAAERAETR